MPFVFTRRHRTPRQHVVPVVPGSGGVTFFGDYFGSYFVSYFGT